jgi:hypothetical protein
MKLLWPPAVAILEGLSNDNSRRKFVSDQVVRTVSAFLNSDGGQLIIGIEEQEGVAVKLSDGIPRSNMTWEQLQSSICNRIQPAVADYVSVFSIPVTERGNGEKLFAFVVDVMPGFTAYQADDKKYYGRRAGQSEAMEDKDIRLRMLAADKPRFDINLRPRIVGYGKGPFSQFIQNITWDLEFKNVGLTNIPQAIVRSELNLEGLSELGCKAISAWTPEHLKTDFGMEDIDHAGLLPGQQFKYPIIKIHGTNFAACLDPASVIITANITVFINNGLPAELRSYDVMASLRSIIGLESIVDAQWQLPSDRALF